MKFTEATYLSDGTLRLYNSTSEGSGFVILVHPFTDVELLSIPQYGGEERHEGWYETIGCALKEAEKWT
jgi:hypothetical protein